MQNVIKLSAAIAYTLLIMRGKDFQATLIPMVCCCLPAASSAVTNNYKAALGGRHGPFGVAKLAVWQRRTARAGMRYAPFGNCKRRVAQVAVGQAVARPG